MERERRRIVEREVENLGEPGEEMPGRSRGLGTVYLDPRVDCVLWAGREQGK